MFNAESARRGKIERIEKRFWSEYS